MRIIVLPILKIIELKEYDIRLDPEIVEVWVNPPRKFIAERDGAYRDFIKKQPEPLDAARKLETFNTAIVNWHAILWSKGADVERHFSADEVCELSDVDPAFFDWLLRESAQALREHRQGQKKNR